MYMYSRVYVDRVLYSRVYVDRVYVTSNLTHEYVQCLIHMCDLAYSELHMTHSHVIIGLFCRILSLL